MPTQIFIRSAAPAAADAALLVELTMGLALIAGAVLARRRNYGVHAWCQSAVVLLNLVAIGFAMVPSFYIQVAPKLPQATRRSYYALATAHAAFGTLAEMVGLYVIVAAGTRILPKRLLLRNYRAWMRATLILWWVVLILGVATYLRWYVYS
jgi:uncharacterized membrane protein YozB (DUF420 family)